VRMFEKSHKLDNVCYDIRGAALEEAKRLEEEGYTVLRLNIGNPAAFNFTAPDEMIHDIIINLHNAQGYCESQGLFSARKAVMQYCQRLGIEGVEIDDIFIGNGVSELIVMAMQGLLDNGDEILIPAPDYPLWTAAVSLAGGSAVHYLCDEEQEWYPDLKDIESKITPRTKGLVIINPNNPTGSVYPEDIINGVIGIARENDLILFSDEIYDKIIYDDHRHICAAAQADDIFQVTFNGLSKVYRAAGFRTGWMVLSGKKTGAEGYIEGLNILSNMRLCSNVPSQFAIQTALGGYQSIQEYTAPGGRLYQQREICYNMLSEIPGISCVKPKGALYLFPKIDVDRFSIKDDQKFVLDFLREKRILLVQGSGFNWKKPDHFRIVFLPREEEIIKAMKDLGEFLETYVQG